MNKLREHLPTIISIIVFILMSLSVPYLSYTGAFTYDETLTEPLNATFTEDGIIELVFADNVTSFKLSGEIKGAGTAYLKTGNSRLLVFNSTSSSLINACIETCEITGGKTGILEIFVQEGSIELDKLAYTIQIVNEPPEWIGNQNFTLQVGKPLVIDLHNYFSDDDPLTFVVTKKYPL